MTSKRDLSLALLAISIVAVLCTTPLFCLAPHEPKPLGGTLTGINEYGNFDTSLTKQELEMAGYRFGDNLRFQCGEIELVAVYIDQYDGAIPYQFSISTNYGSDIVSLMVFNSTATGMGLFVGDRFQVSYGGRCDNEALYPSIFEGVTISKLPGQSDEDFANFRCIRFNDDFHLYRGGCPVFLFNGVDRMDVLDDLCRRNSIDHCINISDDEAEFNTMIENAREGGYCPYTIGMYEKAQIDCFYSHVDTIQFAEDLAPTFRAILDSPEDELYVFCHLGKDRTGFVFLLLEALAGWDMDSIADDYCISFVNLYGIQKDSDEYRNIVRDFFGRTVFLLAHPYLIEGVAYIDWSEVDYTKVDIRSAAKAFLLNNVLLTPDEVGQLEALVLP